MNYLHETQIEVCFLLKIMKKLWKIKDLFLLFVRFAIIMISIIMEKEAMIWEK